MSAAIGVDPNRLAFSRYSGVFHGCFRTTRTHGGGRPSTSRGTSPSPGPPGAVPEGAAEGLAGAHRVEVRVEPRVLDRDALPLPRPAEDLDHGHLVPLGALRGLPAGRGGDDPDVVRRHLTPSPRSSPRPRPSARGRAR